MNKNSMKKRTKPRTEDLIDLYPEFEVLVDRLICSLDFTKAKKLIDDYLDKTNDMIGYYELNDLVDDFQEIYMLIYEKGE